METRFKKNKNTIKSKINVKKKKCLELFCDRIFTLQTDLKCAKFTGSQDMLYGILFLVLLSLLVRWGSLRHMNCIEMTFRWTKLSVSWIHLIIFQFLMAVRRYYSFLRALNLFLVKTSYSASITVLWGSAVRELHQYPAVSKVVRNTP